MHIACLGIDRHGTCASSSGSWCEGGEAIARMPACVHSARYAALLSRHNIFEKRSHRVNTYASSGRDIQLMSPGKACMTVCVPASACLCMILIRADHCSVGCVGFHAQGYTGVAFALRLRHTELSAWQSACVHACVCMDCVPGSKRKAGRAASAALLHVHACLRVAQA